jgi:hypothetical protein
MNKWIIAAIMAAVLLATTSDCNINPADKTPAKPPAPTIEIVMEVTKASEARDVFANIKVNAVDYSGLPVVDVVTGELYPTQHLYRIPYTHYLVQPATASARYSIEATVAGVPGDIFGCAIYVNGTMARGPGTPHVVEIPEGGQSTFVYCEHEVFGSS